jgi:hypothetical protein
VSFLEESAATRKGALAWITRRQGYLFFPLLLLEGLNLHAKSIRSLGSRTPVTGRDHSCCAETHVHVRFPHDA